MLRDKVTGFFVELSGFHKESAPQLENIASFDVISQNTVVWADPGINYIDSTLLRVCHIKREKQHRVFKGIAEKGKSTMGWFFGFKLHLIINDKGELLSFYLTKGNVDDRNIELMTAMTKDVFGKIFGDKGYISKALAELLFKDGIQLVTKVRKNMKKQNLSDLDAILLRKRALVESVNNELKNICKVEHTRHRSVKGFLVNLIAGLTACCFFSKKSSLNITPIKTNQMCLWGLKHYSR